MRPPGGMRPPTLGDPQKTPVFEAKLYRKDRIGRIGIHVLFEDFHPP